MPAAITLRPGESSLARIGPLVLDRERSATVIATTERLILTGTDRILEEIPYRDVRALRSLAVRRGHARGVPDRQELALTTRLEDEILFEGTVAQIRQLAGILHGRLPRQPGLAGRIRRLVRRPRR